MKIGVMGATGRMGRTVISQILNSETFELGGGIEHPGHELMGVDLGHLVGREDTGISLTEDGLEIIARVDGIIDFTAPEASVELAGLAAQARIVHVMGTTGLTQDDMAKLKAAARHATIIQSGNMSLGVNLVAQVTKRVAAMLGEEWDIEIVEMHHRHKVDAPSGTALLLGQAAADGRGVELDEVSDRGRDGQTGPRETGHIGFASLRGGSVVGDHSVVFAGERERVELTHRADDRAIFAKGALTAVQWGFGRGPGLYSMADVLGFSTAP